MSTEVRSGAVPLYARVLRLRRIRITGFASFLLVEGTIATAVLLALAELVSWWAVPLLPVLVAAVVKINDAVGRPAPPPAPTGEESDPVTVRRAASQPAHDWTPPADEAPDPAHQWTGPDVRRPRQRAGHPDQRRPWREQPEGVEPDRTNLVAGLPVPAGIEPAWGRHAAQPVTDDGGSAPPPAGLPGSQAQRRAHIIGAAVRRSMAQAQLGANGGGNAFGTGGLGRPAGSSGRHSRRDETTERHARRNDRGFGRFA